MSLVLATTATKIINYGGGTMHRTKRNPDNGLKVDIQSKTDRGSDYVVFQCPHPSCGRWNKLCMYQAEAYHVPGADRIPFKCKKCRNIIEVARPVEAKESLIITPDDFKNEMAQRRRNSTVNTTKLGRP